MTKAKRFDTQASRGLGWASIGIGVAEIFTTRLIKQLLGIRGGGWLLRLFGVREILSGAGILSQRKPSPKMEAGLWSRVAGDTIDVAMLALAARTSRNRNGLLLATTMVLGITAMDLYLARRVHTRNTRTS